MATDVDAVMRLCSCGDKSFIKFIGYVVKLWRLYGVALMKGAHGS